jgi:pimeloyl-ACP methyl ester carboxylesterase
MSESWQRAGSSPVAETFAIKSNGVRLVGDQWHAERPKGVVLLLHRGGQTRHSWTSAAQELAGRGWTAVTIDARGHGESQWSRDGDYSIDAMVDDLAATVDMLDACPALIGASMGGMTSLIALGERRVRASVLVLVDIAPPFDEAGAARIRAFMSANMGGFASLDDVADAIQAYNPHRPRPSNLDGLRKNVRASRDGRWYWHWDPAFLRLDDEPSRQESAERRRVAASAIDVPMLLARGAHSDVVTPESVREFLELNPLARYVDIAGSGHMVAGDSNAVFAVGVIDFLDSLHE